MRLRVQQRRLLRRLRPRRMRRTPLTIPEPQQHPAPPANRRGRTHTRKCLLENP
ncbi:hypothetical protein SGPA1_30785 [Streptomyces misionensis JCM 4497]